eukprot:g12641.t1
MVIQPIVLHATRTNAGVVGINNEATRFTDNKGNLRYIGRIKSYAKDRGNNSYGFVECPEIQKEYGGDAFLRKDQYLDCFEVGDKVSFLLDLSKEGKPQAVDLMPSDGQETQEYLDSVRRMNTWGAASPPKRKGDYGGSSSSSGQMLPVPDPLYEKRRRLERDYFYRDGVYSGSGPAASSSSSSGLFFQSRDQGRSGSFDRGGGGRSWRDGGGGGMMDHPGGGWEGSTPSSWGGGGSAGKGASRSGGRGGLPGFGSMPNPFGPSAYEQQMATAAAILAHNPVLQTAALLQAFRDRETTSAAHSGADPRSSGGLSRSLQQGWNPTRGTHDRSAASSSSIPAAASSFSGSQNAGSATSAAFWEALKEDDNEQFGEALRQLLAAPPQNSNSTTSAGPGASGQFHNEAGQTLGLGGGGGTMMSQYQGLSLGASGSGLAGLVGGAGGNLGGLSGQPGNSNSNSTALQSLLGDASSAEEFSPEDWTQFLQYLATDPGKQ